jgi:DNA-binding MarR family transcriptional regulator
MHINPQGLGTQLRRLLALLDGGLQRAYDARQWPFKPRFYPFLRQLLASDGASVTDLSAGAGVTQPAATQTLREMAAAGLVEQRPGTDRRSRRLWLTPRARTLARDLAGVWEATSAAAARLDAELPAPLFAVVAQAIIALEHRPFFDRIEDELS